jgi:cell wall-associated NlpC family hydrolase
VTDPTRPQAGVRYSETHVSDLRSLLTVDPLVAKARSQPSPTSPLSHRGHTPEGDPEGEFVRVLTHARRRALSVTAVIVTATSVLATAGVMTLTSSEAAAQSPVAFVSAEARTAPLSVEQKAAALATVVTELGRAAVVEAKATRATAAVQVRTRILKVARAQLGDRYSAGATGPNAFDCSGFTRYVYKVAAGKELPHQSRSQYGVVKRISLKQAKPGDLVFFFRNGAHHVGIYIGNHHMIDAAGYGEGVKVSPITGSWWSATYSGVGRVLPA